MSEVNQIVTTAHGGYREGSGRKVGSKDAGQRLTKAELASRIYRLQQIGALATTSRKVMHALGDAEYWLRVIGKLENEREWTSLVDVLKFHQQMDEGRPAQRINITSQSVNISVREVEQARAVVRELMTPTPLRNHLVISGEHNALAGEGGKKGDVK